MTDAGTPRRAGYFAGPFGLHPAAPILARLPLLPADARGGAEGLLDEGVFLASRYLGTKRVRTPRSRQSMRAYELRARFRPTPHGEFAGVTLAEIVDGSAELRLGTRHRARSNPSAAWLASAFANLLDDTTSSGVLHQLTLTAEGTAVRRGERWEVEAPSTSDHSVVQRSTVRATGVSDLIMAVCAGGTSTSGVLKAVRSRWPLANKPLVLDAIAEMIRQGFLLPDVLSGDASDDPIGGLLCVLPPAHSLREALLELRTTLAVADAYDAGQAERTRALAEARDRADRICRVERPLTVDVALDARIGVPAGLVAEAIEAAGVLWRIAPAQDPAEEFHERFADRYGHHRYVPLLEAADPVIGIGPETPPKTGAEPDSAHLALLAGLIAKAVGEHVVEVDLDEQTIVGLAGLEKKPPRSAEIYVRLIADGDQAEADGALRVAVAGCVPTAGSTLGRFALLLDHCHTEPEFDQAVIAELAVRPRMSSMRTAVPTTGFARRRIPVGVPGGREGDLSLADLMLVSDGEHLRVWSASLNVQVIPTLFSRLAPRLLPPVARLLYILGQGGATPLHRWSWGDAGAGPFQPRIRYRTSILSPARWTIPPMLIAAAIDAERWESELDRWRASCTPAPPSVVLTDHGDQQLPLLLDYSVDRALLRRYVRRGMTAVTEQFGGQGAKNAVAKGLNGCHVTELVIPLISRVAPPAVRHRAEMPARAHGVGLFHPGGPWLSLAIPTAPHLQDELLLRIVDLSREMAGSWDTWFWLRYHTNALGHHLRIRFHGRPEELGGQLLPAVAAWSAALNDQRLAGRLIVESYEQEIERYGGPRAIELVEKVFAADSCLVLNLLSEEPDGRMVAAAQVAALIVRTVAENDLSALAGRQLQRSGRQTMNRLRPIVRSADAALEELRPGSNELFAALRHRLVSYRDAVPARLRASCASSLIHMHANRALSSGDDEPLMRALAADLIALTS